MIKYILIFLILLGSFNLCAPTHKEDFKTYEEVRLFEIERSEFDIELLKEYLDLVGINNKDIVLAKTMLETNYYSSNIFKENNNLFGMKRPSIRPTTVIGSSRGHATYTHWTESVKDYKLWYEYFITFGDYDSYLDFLIRNNYAEDPRYIQKLNYIIALL